MINEAIRVRNDKQSEECSVISPGYLPGSVHVPHSVSQSGSWFTGNSVQCHSQHDSSFMFAKDIYKVFTFKAPTEFKQRAEDTTFIVLSLDDVGSG